MESINIVGVRYPPNSVADSGHGGRLLPKGVRQPIITARKRSLGQGSMFTVVCLSTGGVPGLGGMPGPGGMPGLGGACSGGGCLVETPRVLRVVRMLLGGAWWKRPPDGYCCGWYASYWNALLFCNILPKNYMKMEEFETGEPPLDLPMKLLGNGIFQKKLPTIIQLGHDSSDFNLSWQYSNVSSFI